MATTLNFKNIIDLPEWRPLANIPGATAAGTALAFDLRNDEDRYPYLYYLRSAVLLDAYSIKNDEWFTLTSPALAGTFGAGACAYFMPTHGPRGTVAAGCSTTSIVLSTALPAAVGVNNLANRGDGRGFRIRIMGNTAGGSGLTEERLIVANTGGTTPTLILDSALSFVPANGSTYEILSGRVYLLSASTAASGTWKAYDIATNSYLTLGYLNLPTIGTDSSIVGLDAGHIPYNMSLYSGFWGLLTSTGIAAGTLTGHAAAGDAGLLVNEHRNFIIRITEDATNPQAVGQRRLISSNTAGPSPVYSITPNWSTNPTVGAKYVIENSDLMLLFTAGGGTTYTYCPYAIGALVADTWSTTAFAVRGANMGAGCSSEQAFGIQPDSARNARWGHIFSFRGGNVNTLDLLDITASATGTWTNNIVYRNQSANILVTTGTSEAYAPATEQGKYMYLVINGTQRFTRFDMLNRVLEPFAWLRYAQSTAVVGLKIATTLYIDGATKLSFLCAQRQSGAEFFQVTIPAI